MHQTRHRQIGTYVHCKTVFIITKSKMQQENETDNYVNIELRKQNP